MTRTAARLAALEREAHRDPSLEVWHELIETPGVFERLGDWNATAHATMTRAQLDEDPPEGVRRIVVCYVDGEPNVSD